MLAHNSEICIEIIFKFQTFKYTVSFLWCSIYKFNIDYEHLKDTTSHRNINLYNITHVLILAHFPTPFSLYNLETFS